MEWIKVEDKLPECGEVVLVFTQDFGMHMAYLNVRKIWKYHFNSEVFQMGKITHWMPKPAEPKL